MAGHSERLARYQELRKIGLPLNNRLVASLPKNALEQAIKKLGLAQSGIISVPTDNLAAVLMDYCLHDLWHNGINAIESFLTKSPPPPDSDDMLILQAKRQAYYTFVVVEEVEAGVGVQVRDVAAKAFFLMDVSFSTSATKGAVMATRIMEIDGIHMTTGATLPVGVIEDEQQRRTMNTLVKQLGVHKIPRVSPQEASEIVAKTIRSLLEAGSASNVAYRDLEDLDSEPSRSDFHSAWEDDYERQVPVLAHGGTPRVGRNDRCPCGSGKKFKHCCGGRR